jgi:aldose 1-epimerase
MATTTVKDGLCTLDAGNGIVARVAEVGATLLDLQVPDRNGRIGSVVLGLDDVAAYASQSAFLGAIVGRVANRIRDARFALDGTTYRLEANDPPHHLHGGSRGWHRARWRMEPAPCPDGAAVALTLVSPDGDAGYPGTVTARVVYALTPAGALRIEMEATTDRATPVAMAPHAYFNLAGAGTVLDHRLTVLADSTTPGDPIVPTGAVVPVEGTPFDFRRGAPVLPDLDTNFVVSGDGYRSDGNPERVPWTSRDGSAGQSPAPPTRLVARLADPRSGRTMEVHSDQPGLQVYAGRYLDGSTSGRGFRHQRHAGICLETQAFPDAINVPAWQHQVVLRPGQRYQHRMAYVFATTDA